MLNRLSSLSFRTRSADRDAETDRLRHDRLVKLVDEIALEVMSEHRGLKLRYDEACVSAGFALADAVPSDAGREAMVSDLSATVLACERRLMTLSHHMKSLAAVRAEIDGMNAQPLDDRS